MPVVAYLLATLLALLAIVVCTFHPRTWTGGLVALSLLSFAGAALWVLRTA